MKSRSTRSARTGHRARCCPARPSVLLATAIGLGLVCSCSATSALAQGGGGPIGPPKTTSYTVQLTSTRAIDGRNSGLRPTFGAAGTTLLRKLPAAYPGDATGSEIIVPPARANPRTISNLVCTQTGPIFNREWLSDYVWAWGQFLDHDLDLTNTNPANGTAPIEIEDPADILGPNPIPFSRSDFIIGQSTAQREQINAITAFIDASNVYGSDATRALALRELQGGRLKVGASDLLPFNDQGLDNGPSASDATQFLAGDIRANENVVLTCLHTLFVREHNRLANLIALHDPLATDEQIYQLARKLVGAEMQLITYQEFLPAILGGAAPRLRDGGGDPTVDPGINTEFSTAFYRVGHTLLSPRLQLAHQGLPQGSIALRDAFFRPTFLSQDPYNLDRLLGGLQLQRAQNIDTRIIDDVRNFLFGAPGAGGLDLAALNIQRGRDHGLPDYNRLREVYGMPKLRSFSAITFDPTLQRQLELAYGNVDNIDPWVGALAENHVPGISVGPLLMVALRDQFLRTLQGDRFNVVNDRDLQQPLAKAVLPLDQVRLADIVRWNTEIVAVNDDVFHALPAVLSDVTVHYDPAANRLFVVGNRLTNRIVVWQATSTLMVVSGLGPTRVNGRQVIFLTTRPRPHLTLDLGLGHDVVSLVLCDLGDVALSMGAGRNVFSCAFSRAQRLFYNGTSANDQLVPPGGLPTAN